MVCCSLPGKEMGIFEHLFCARQFTYMPPTSTSILPVPSFLTYPPFCSICSSLGKKSSHGAPTVCQAINTPPHPLLPLSLRPSECLLMPALSLPRLPPVPSPLPGSSRPDPPLLRQPLCMGLLRGRLPFPLLSLPQGTVCGYPTCTPAPPLPHFSALLLFSSFPPPVCPAHALLGQGVGKY